MSTIELSDIPATKQRMLASYAVRNKTTISAALLTNSIDGLVSQEAYATLQDILRTGEIPEAFVDAAEASAAAQAATLVINPTGMMR